MSFTFTIYGTYLLEELLSQGTCTDIKANNSRVQITRVFLPNDNVYKPVLWSDLHLRKCFDSLEEPVI
uniref:Uncharacterized protein n=1 Tax=Anguilla anguilla TaxID=7936 RepID=A0A0E9TU30_ANGAN